MKRTFLALILLAGLASCSKEPQPMTKAEKQHKIDSLTAVRIRESDAQAARDLQHRIEIEVKVKADSIATILRAAKDTANKPKPATPAAPIPKQHIPGL